MKSSVAKEFGKITFIKFTKTRKKNGNLNVIAITWNEKLSSNYNKSVQRYKNDHATRFRQIEPGERTYMDGTHVSVRLAGSLESIVFYLLAGRIFIINDYGTLLSHICP